MRTMLAFVAALTLLATSCATVDTTSHPPAIEVDGDFSDWRELNAAPVVSDPEGDVADDGSSGDVKAVYFRREGSRLIFYVAYVTDVNDPAFAPRLWLDANGDGAHDGRDYQIDVIDREVRVQTLADPFEGYLDVRSGAASLPNSVEFWVHADDVVLGDDFGLSGVIAYWTDSGMSVVDSFSQQVATSGTSSNHAGSSGSGRHVMPTAADMNNMEVMPLERIVYDELVLINDPEISKHAFYYYIPSHVADDHPVKTVVVGNGHPRPESYAALAEDVRHTAEWYSSYCDDHGYAMIKLLTPGVAQYFHRELMFADPDPADPLVRPDLEIASVIRGFMDKASDEGLDMHPRVFMTGGSNGGIQSNYFPMLHPGLVEATAIASAGIYIYPTGDYNGTRLPYPAGVADVDDIDGVSFSIQEFSEVDHFVVVGQNDTNEVNDPISILDEPYLSFYTEHLGTTQADRVAPYVEYLQSIGMDATFKIYPGLGHGLTSEWNDDTFRFFDGVALEDRIGADQSSVVDKSERSADTQPTITTAEQVWRPTVLFAESDEDKISNNGVVITEDEILVRDRRTGALETAFFWSYRLDETTSTLEIEFRENPDFDFSWMTTLVCAYVVPWEKGDQRGYFVRNSTKRRGTNPGTDNFNATFTHDYEDRQVEGFLFTRLMLQPRYDYKDETIITNPWGSWSFTDRTLEYGEDGFHTILGPDRP